MLTFRGGDPVTPPPLNMAVSCKWVIVWTHFKTLYHGEVVIQHGQQWNRTWLIMLIMCYNLLFDVLSVRPCVCIFYDTVWQWLTVSSTVNSLIQHGQSIMKALLLIMCNTLLFYILSCLSVLVLVYFKILYHTVDNWWPCSNEAIPSPLPSHSSLILFFLPFPLHPTLPPPLEVGRHFY